MAAKLNLGVIELDLEKISSLVKEMISINLDEDSKRHVKELVNEINIAYNNLVDCYVDFMPLRKNDDDFEKSFLTVFGNFKKTYLKSPEDNEASCGRIHNALYKILEGRWYLSKLPKLNQKIKQFRDSADAWYLNDTVMVETFKEFNTQLYKELSAVEAAYGNEPISQSRQRLDSIISQWENEFLDLRKKLNDFKNLSNDIR